MHDLLVGVVGLLSRRGSIFAHICIGDLSASFGHICIYNDLLVTLLLATAIFVFMMMCIGHVLYDASSAKISLLEKKTFHLQ